MRRRAAAVVCSCVSESLWAGAGNALDRTLSTPRDGPVSCSKGSVREKAKLWQVIIYYKSGHNRCHNEQPGLNLGCCIGHQPPGKREMPTATRTRQTASRITKAENVTINYP